MLWIWPSETGLPSGDRKLAPDVVIHIDVVVLEGVGGSLLSLNVESSILFVAGNNVSIFVGEVVDKADIAADNALLDLSTEDTKWFPVFSSDNFAIDVVDVLAVERAAVQIPDGIAGRFSR